jgi:hypothetical protein
MIEDRNQPERPRVEPEIIPPDRKPPRSAWRRQAWQPSFSTAADEAPRVYVARLGPLGFALLMLIVGIVVGLIILAVIGAVLIWIPIMLMLVAVGALFRLLRR